MQGRLRKKTSEGGENDQLDQGLLTDEVILNTDLCI